MKVLIVSRDLHPGPGGNPNSVWALVLLHAARRKAYRHTTTCDKASDCVFLVGKGPFDLKMVNARKGHHEVRAVEIQAQNCEMQQTRDSARRRC